MAAALQSSLCSPMRTASLPLAGPSPRCASNCSVRHGVQHSGRRNRFQLSARAESTETTETDKKKTDLPEQSTFNKVTDWLSFAEARSERDAELIWEAKETTKTGQKMTPEQYMALRRKVGGTSKDFFKEWIEVDGEYTDEGWVDKTCHICKQDTDGSEGRTVDGRGRYAHAECLATRQQSGNIFTRLFSL